MRKNIVTTEDRTSATMMANQMPSRPMIRGRISTAEIWKTRVLRNEIIAETPPLFSAVKKDEPKMLKPVTR